MRLVVTCDLRRAVAVPINHQELLTGVVYRFLASGDGDYARFLHDEGYVLDGGQKRFKMFCFSGLRAPAQRRRQAGETLWLGPGLVDWYIGSPVDLFLRNFATGLLAQGVLQVGTQTLPIAQVQAMPMPDFSSGEMRFTCWSPMVASVGQEGGGTRYLRPCEGAEFSTAVANNLRSKLRVLRGSDLPAEEGRFELEFAQDYLADPRHRGGTKLIRYKEINIVGAQAPFRAKGSPAMLQAMYDCGAGEKNATGFGMVAVNGVAGG